MLGYGASSSAFSGTFEEEQAVCIKLAVRYSEKALTSSRQEAPQVANEIEVLLDLFSCGGAIKGVPTCLWSRSIRKVDAFSTILVTKEVGAVLSRIAVATLDLKDIYTQLKATLCAVHVRGYLHHDLSPSNIIIMDDGSAILLDWGLAQKKGAPSKGFSGTKMFASVSYSATPANYMYVPEDDLESLIYTLCSIHHELPWAKKTTDKARVQKKRETSVDAICGGLDFLKKDLTSLRKRKSD